MGKTIRKAMTQDVMADMGRSRAGAAPADSSIRIYRNEVPQSAGSELDRLYGALYSSSAYLRICGNIDGIHTYVAYRDGRIGAIFLFLLEGTTVRVVNEGMRLDSSEISRFARHIFANFPKVGVVSFNAVQSAGRPIPFVHQRFFFAEDFIAPLPATPAAYLASLGSATRKNIKRHKNRIERDFPSFRHALHEGRDVDEQVLRSIIELNRLRMASKNKTSFIDETVTQEIIRLVRECGEVCVATIDGKLCAGTIIFRVGGSHISKVHAHDMRYDDYRLGMVCCYLAVCACIERGGVQFHFGHGRYEYKTALLGEHQAFDKLRLYRSRWQMLRHARMAMSIATAGYRLRFGHWLDQGTGQGRNMFWRTTGAMLGAWRAFKQRRAEG